ncbi:hypothetical protein T07_6397, partial [Trichinella nelsoni]
LMFFLVTQVRNCEDESRILNDLHRITAVESVKYVVDKVMPVNGLQGLLNYVNFRRKYLRECPGHSLKANENLHIALKLWITSSHEACTVCNPCSHGRKGVSYPSQWAFAYHKKTGRCTSQHFVLDSNGLLAADATLKLFFMVLMFFLVTQVRNCEDEPHLE